MRVVLHGACVAALVFVAGCGGGGTTEPAKPYDSQVQEMTAGSTTELKKRLEEVASSGIAGSGLVGVKESIEKAVRPANAKLADELTKDLEQLSQAQDSAKVKEIAGRMAGKL